MAVDASGAAGTGATEPGRPALPASLEEAWGRRGRPGRGPRPGLSLDQIATDLHDPSNPVAQALDGSANYLIAALCSVAGQGAAPICASSTIVRAEAVLDGTGPIPTTVPAATSSANRT